MNCHLYGQDELKALYYLYEKGWDGFWMHLYFTAQPWSFLGATHKKQLSKWRQTSVNPVRYDCSGNLPYVPPIQYTFNFYPIIITLKSPLQRWIDTEISKILIWILVGMITERQTDLFWLTVTGSVFAGGTHSLICVRSRNPCLEDTKRLICPQIAT